MHAVRGAGYIASEPKQFEQGDTDKCDQRPVAPAVTQEHDEAACHDIPDSEEFEKLRAFHRVQEVEYSSRRSLRRRSKKEGGPAHVVLFSPQLSLVKQITASKSSSVC